jgi:endonuclease/exonuclease/phosphatase family metal-dependent hydrolase
MKKFFIICMLFVSTAFSQETVKVMTYNLQGMKPGTDPETRLINIIEKLKVIDPDIIGLQEINESLNGGGIDNQAKRIADSLSAFFGVEYHYFISFTHLSWNNQFREFVGIISKYPVEEEGFLSLVPGVFPRKLVWNYINTPLGKINFFNTHLSFNSASVRFQQVQQIIPYIENIESANPGIATILTGDFNDQPFASSIQLLTETGTDTFYISTFAEVNPGDPGYTMPSNAPNAKIDYVFYKNTGSLAIDTSIIVMDQPYSGNNFCSDHLGILTTFKEGVVSVDESIDLQPDKFELYQNYPNPFNPTTKIKYSIPTSPINPSPYQGEGQRERLITLKVYNVLRSEIVTIVNEQKTTGSYQIEFNATNLPIGIYFYQLIVENFSDTKKMVLLR